MGSLAMASESFSRENLTTTFQEFNQSYSETELSDQYLEYPQTDLFKNNDSWPKYKISKNKNQVFLEGTYVESSSSTGTADDDEQIGRTKSLTDEDLEELKGCLDLGFGFSYEEIPELCNTLPALELCYSMSQKFLDEQQQHKSQDSADSTVTLPEAVSPPSGPIANWKISSPGDHPDDVKARLKFWAQAVACTVRLCS